MKHKARVLPFRDREAATIASVRKDPRFAAEYLNSAPEQSGQEERPLAPFNCPACLRIRAISAKPALQSAGRRRNILWARCPAAINQQQTAAIGPAREMRRD